MSLPRKTSRREDHDLKRRLLGCLPATRFEIDTLGRLAEIKVSRHVPTAAVDCTRRPRLRINPDFVKDRCERDEHLFLLVMHELHHVLMAHTRMYPRMTPAHNIAFDAIINAGLMRHFIQPEYRGFFESMYQPDQFPECLLRPPEGWPHNPQYPDPAIGPPGLVSMMQRLYPARHFSMPPLPMYEEVLSLLMRGGNFNAPMLIGNHDGELVNDPLMKAVMREVAQSWPDMVGLGKGRGTGNQLAGQRRPLTPSSEEARRAFSRMLKLALIPRRGKIRRKARLPVPADGGTGVLPNPYDRLAPARRQLGGADLLYNQIGSTRARIPEQPAKANVYLDVSGSMNFVISHLLDLLLPYAARGEAEIYQFSTEVVPLTWGELREGRLNTTGGTDINCVLNHALGVRTEIQKIIVLTDGEVGAPLPHLANGLVERDIKMHVVMAYGCNLHYACHPISASILNLPPVA